MSNNTENFTILIHDNGRDSWASFASWYSAQRFLPEAEFVVIRPWSHQAINWPYRCKLKMTSKLSLGAFEKLKKPVFPLPPFTALLRPLTDEEKINLLKMAWTDSTVTAPDTSTLIGEVAEDTHCPFVRFQRFGRFDADIWATHESRPAIQFTERLRGETSNASETKIIKLLADIYPAFLVLERD